MRQEPRFSRKNIKERTRVTKYTGVELTLRDFFRII